ncbi:Lipid A 3-O-deacylase (PagL) [Flavobacterium fryxellicola]|uniref:Lipid A 3-O-deacylase n=1 Tax=Flavobacterium fryxellicola TaxID=249352 RepID=A0A167ULU2_9FLAO|nr:acyloxyacyl hydrolase [Flavobacterium fryxellicola]OAB25694.1 hypothetical protein FBFR_14420 [Flavobacterium fryxellicola]SHN74030.1 Lipid A 3-O-deacylase (PagL) [Flavobacterium fryxellicola]
MFRSVFFILFICCLSMLSFAQVKNRDVQVGFAYGLGTEFENKNYSYTNHYYKLQFYFEVKETKKVSYQILIQPELNFATHQLLNLYFIEPDEPDYIKKRERYTKLKDIKEYVLNLGFLVRKPLSNQASLYALGSVGPMITDTETERLSKGFAFADVIALGVTFKINRITVDLRPSIRHVSNAGLQKKNSGYTTKNIDLGFLLVL